MHCWPLAAPGGTSSPRSRSPRRSATCPRAEVGAQAIFDGVFVDADELWRHIRLPHDDIQEGSSERILTGMVDRNNFNSFVLTWDDDADSMDIEIFIEVPDGDDGTVRARRVTTIVNVEPGFEF